MNSKFYNHLPVIFHLIEVRNLLGTISVASTFFHHHVNVRNLILKPPISFLIFSGIFALIFHKLQLQKTKPSSQMKVYAVIGISIFLHTSANSFVHVFAVAYVIKSVVNTPSCSEKLCD